MSHHNIVIWICFWSKPNKNENKCCDGNAAKSSPVLRLTYYDLQLMVFWFKWKPLKLELWALLMIILTTWYISRGHRTHNHKNGRRLKYFLELSYNFHIMAFSYIPHMNTIKMNSFESFVTYYFVWVEKLWDFPLLE